jgi:hypothetical protein
VDGNAWVRAGWVEQSASEVATSNRLDEANAYLFDATGEKTMNSHYGLLFSVSIVMSLGLLGPGSWLRAQGRGEVVELGKLKSQVPADWAKEKPDEPSGYRQYRLEAIGDDKEDARLTIDLLRRGSGDSAEKQVERWKAMFFPPQGKQPDGVAKWFVSQITSWLPCSFSLRSRSC